MMHLIDYSVVGLLVLCAVGYAGASLGPRAWRLGVWGAIARATALLPRGLGLRGLSARMHRAAAQSQGSACGGCNNCGSAAPAVTTPTGGEVKIRVAQIGRRVTH